jgi:membrane-associated phospholipid phosphatase
MLETTRDKLGDRSASAADAAAERLAKGLARRDGPAARGLRELGALDRAIYSAVAATPTPSLDEPLRRLSNAANNSGLWLATAAGLSVVGGRAGRRAAVRGTVAIGVTSALVNLAVKSAWSRQRPDRAGVGVPLWRNVRMPTSTSFPSGHAASGFAFAAAIGRDQPWLGVALRFLAATVAYSRVHTGVHYPGDIVVGSLIGEGTGQAVAGLMDRLSPPRRPSRSGRGEQGTPSDAADAEGAPRPAPGPETGLSRPISIRRAAIGVPPGGRRRVVRSRHGPARRAPAGAEGCRGGSPPGPTGPTGPSPPPGGRRLA